jgi:hypothetical protein
LVLLLPPLRRSRWNRFTWTGIYAGGYVGGLWSKVDGNFLSRPPASWETAPALVGGAILGLQYQWGNFVFGAEGREGADLIRGKSPPVRVALPR